VENQIYYTHNKDDGKLVIKVYLFAH